MQNKAVRFDLQYPTFCVQASQHIVCVVWEEPPVIEQHRQQLGHRRAAGEGEEVLAVRVGDVYTHMHTGRGDINMLCQHDHTLLGDNVQPCCGLSP